MTSRIPTMTVRIGYGNKQIDDPVTDAYRIDTNRIDGTMTIYTISECLPNKYYFTIDARFFDVTVMAND